LIEVAVYNRSGEQVDSVAIDEAVLGGAVRYPLLKQAIVMYHANKRVGTAATKSRGMIRGSGRKLFKQKGTGSARVGNSRTSKRVGGGVSFSKSVRDFSKRMPKKQRRLARDNAVLAKLVSNNAVIVDELHFDMPQTNDFTVVLDNLKIERSCLVVVNGYSENVYKSGRNVRRVKVMPLGELNAGDICNHQKLLFTRDAFLKLGGKDKQDKSQAV